MHLHNNVCCVRFNQNRSNFAACIRPKAKCDDAKEWTLAESHHALSMHLFRYAFCEWAPHIYTERERGTCICLWRVYANLNQYESMQEICQWQKDDFLLADFFLFYFAVCTFFSSQRSILSNWLIYFAFFFSFLVGLNFMIRTYLRLPLVDSTSSCGSMNFNCERLWRHHK